MKKLPPDGDRASSRGSCYKFDYSNVKVHRMKSLLLLRRLGMTLKDHQEQVAKTFTESDTYESDLGCLFSLGAASVLGGLLKRPVIMLSNV